MAKIKLFDPHVGKEEELAVNKVLKSRFWASGAGGGNVSKFEKSFQKYVDSDACIAVNSGTAALNLALSLFDLKNKEVILPALTFVSTAHTVLLNGGKPIFVDVDPNTLCMDPRLIEQSITNRTKIVLPVHFAGMPSDLNPIQKICVKNNLALVEDAAHAAGSTYQNTKIGKHGMAVCFSFHPVKNLAMPTGGLISLNHAKHEEFRKTLLAKRWCGITDRVNAIYDVKKIGWNYYMNEFSAAIGLIQLKKLDRLNNKRKKIAQQYFKEITLDCKMPFNKECSYHIYWVLVNNRTQFMKSMSDKGIETGIHYRPIHTFTLYQKKSNLPVTESVGKRIVSIPIHANLSESDVDKIIYYINKFAK